MTMEYGGKLRILGVPILGISVIYVDNIAVITNESTPYVNIKKKHRLCAYHFIIEVGAAETVCFIYKRSKHNQADALTKALPSQILYNQMKKHLSPT